MPPARGQPRAGMGFGSTAGGQCLPGCPAGGQRLPAANKRPVVPAHSAGPSVISWGSPQPSQICSQGQCRELPGLLPRAGLREGPIGLRGSTKCQALRSGSVAPRVSWALRESGSPWAAESRKSAQGCLGAAGARPVLRGRRQAGGFGPASQHQESPGLVPSPCSRPSLEPSKPRPGSSAPCTSGHPTLQPDLAILRKG